MRKPFGLTLLIVLATLALSQDPYILLPNWVFVCALAVGVVSALLILTLGLLAAT